jgi:hypothetical protein
MAADGGVAEGDVAAPKDSEEGMVPLDMIQDLLQAAEERDRKRVEKIALAGACTR